jgi:hypothetical protein
MKTLNLALSVTAVCGLLVSAAPRTVCDNGIVSNNGNGDVQRMANCVPIQVAQVSAKEKRDESNVIEPRGDGKSPSDHARTW